MEKGFEEHKAERASPKPLGGEVQYSMGAPLIPFLDTGAWAAVRFDNGMVAYEPIQGVSSETPKYRIPRQPEL